MDEMCELPSNNRSTLLYVAVNRMDYPTVLELMNLGANSRVISADGDDM